MTFDETIPPYGGMVFYFTFIQWRKLAKFMEFEPF